VQSAMESYRVVAVYKDPPDFERAAYGLPDMVIPWTSPANFPGAGLVRTLVARADSSSLLGIGAALRVDVTRRHGEGAKVMIWEGDASRPQSDLLGRARGALSDFSILAQALGALILAIACFGIASGIAVEAADRSKEIAIRRAVGLTSFRSALSFCVDGTLTAAVGALLGLALALVFYDSVGAALDPYLGALGLNLGSLGGGLPARAALAPIAAVLAAFLFALLPALRASSGSIADSLKE
ncbi:MAG: FtsX-like permease family protein, partial [Spirochaetota bacterium]